MPSPSSPFNNRATFAKYAIRNSLTKLDEDNDEEGGQKIAIQTCSDGEERPFQYRWHICLDVVGGNPDLIARVEVDMGPTFHRKSHYVQNRPRKVVIPKQQLVVEEEGKEDHKSGDHPDDGQKNHNIVWRCFESKQTCWGWPDPIRFTVVGIYGTVLKVKYHAHGDRSEVVEGHFCEERSDGKSHLEPLPLPPHIDFQFQALSYASNREIMRITEMLRGEGGINVLRDRLAESSTLLTQEAAHVKITVIVPGDSKLESIRKIALNFVKYEAAIDEIIRRYRGHNNHPAPSSPADTPFLVTSNRETIAGKSNRQKHNTLLACTSAAELCQTMNPQPVFDFVKYKLTLVETPDHMQYQFWLPNIVVSGNFLQMMARLWVLFCHNSMRLQLQQPLRSDRTIDEQIDFLFECTVRDRFVEKALLREDAESLLPDADQTATMMNMSDCMDGLSLPDSVALAVAVPLEVFCSPLDSDSQAPDRKRPRGALPNHNEDMVRDPQGPQGTLPAPPAGDDFVVNSSGSTTPVASLRPMFRHYVAVDHNFTSSQLHTILKKLQISIANQKPKRLKCLDQYFMARSLELEHLLLRPATAAELLPRNGILGFELLLEESANSDSIVMILRGGRKASRTRVSVDIAKECGKLKTLSDEEVESVCSTLGLLNGVTHIDAFMDGLLSKVPKEKWELQCYFAIVHDLPCKI